MHGAAMCETRFRKVHCAGRMRGRSEIMCGRPRRSGQHGKLAAARVAGCVPAAQRPASSVHAAAAALVRRSTDYEPGLPSHPVTPLTLSDV
jgi:hypothetical protein